jgi:hypothetical protein
MAIIRHEKQQYANPAALVAETIVPTKNDVTIIESLIRDFNWIEGSVLPSDNIKVIDQTSETANGRRVALSDVTVLTGAGVTDAMENGQSSNIEVTVTGVLLASVNDVLIADASVFPDNVFVVSKEVIADDTVRVVVENQSGDSVPAINFDLKVIQL